MHLDPTLTQAAGVRGSSLPICKTEQQDFIVLTQIASDCLSEPANWHLLPPSLTSHRVWQSPSQLFADYLHGLHRPWQVITSVKTTSCCLLMAAQMLNLIFKVTCIVSTLQGRRKQSADSQAQLDVGGKAINNLRAKCAAKFWTWLL